MSGRSASPDPLALPSSPLARRSTARPLAPRSSKVMRSSPSKSMVLDTVSTRDASPWRIKVTIEAEPKDLSSPSRPTTRTSKVALKTESSSPMTSSSAKRNIGDDRRNGPDDQENETSRPQRKRKGTPMRRRDRKTQSPTAELSTDEDEPIEDVHEPVSLPKRPARRTSPRELTSRTKRLSRAREELDLALQKAVGSSGRMHGLKHYDDSKDEDEDEAEPGDVTVANEDFTMVSVETLQSMKANTSQLLENSSIELGDKRALTVSYMPSSPPQQLTMKVQYPDITARLEKAKTPGRDESMYDAMSWKPTGPEKTATPTKTGRQRAHQQQQRLDSEPTEWRLQRQAVSREIENANTSRVITIEDTTHAEAGEPEGDDDDEEQAPMTDADIWAEEASRSLDEDEDAEQQPAEQAPRVADLFSDQALKPLRPKIPRTWRRSSGMDFSYVDSPEYGALKTRKASATSTDGEGDGAGSRGSGVLTPPSSEEDAVDEGDTSLTEPDAAATELQARGEEIVDEDEGDGSGSDSSVDGPEGEDSGMFWQTNLPNVYHRRPRPRPQRRAMDLSELLNLDKSSPVKPQSRSKVAGSALTETNTRPSSRMLQGPSGSSLFARPKEKVVNSPLRRSLLKSSKIGGCALPASDSSDVYIRHSPAAREVKRTTNTDAQASISDSFQSQASDQRQLLAEMTLASTKKERQSALREEQALARMPADSEMREAEPYSGDETQHPNDDVEEPDDAEQDSEQASRSYEERLNLDSPQKIRVNFNDSDRNSSLLAPKKAYPPLFTQAQSGSRAHKQESATSPPSVTLVSKKATSTRSESQSGIFGRLSSTFWSAVVRPSGPTLIDPKPEPIYPQSLRTLIRSRYGVLSNQHPWTMAHMRTIHRLHNSCTSGRSDSVVPKSGPLPSQLQRLIGKELQCVTPDFRWVFTEQHAHVVDAFMQVLVPEHVAESMRRGDIAFLGDCAAKEHRGMLVGRHGDDLVWGDGDGVKLPKGEIRMDFAVKAVGNCVMANIETARKEEAERKRLEGIERRRREWERSIGVQDDDEDGDGYEVDNGLSGDETLHDVQKA